MEEEEVEIPVVKEPTKDATKMDTDETPGDAAAPPGTSETDANMQDAKGDGPGVENGVPESGDKSVQMETDTKVSSSHFAYAAVAYVLLVSCDSILNV